MTEYYYRLVTILVNICPRPLRALFLKHAKTDTNVQTPYTTLGAYLTSNKTKIRKLSKLRSDQFDLLYPSKGLVDINGWDITLLSALLNTLFQIDPKDKTSVNNIRKIRNDLQHIAGTCKLSKKDFKDKLKQLRADTQSLALSVKGQRYANKIKSNIADVETSVLTNLGDVLRDWYMNKILTLETEIDNMKEPIKEIKGDTGKTIQTLKKTTVMRTRTGGKIQKRFKTVDHILENMRGKFDDLFKNKLDDDFQDPPETTRIMRELKDNHLVVVSGYGKGLYLQAALSAIDNQKYGKGNCVVVSNPSDWRHIGNEDAELVVFLYPFGEKAFDYEKAKSMFSIMDNVKETSTVEDNDDVMDVVIITDQSILEESKQHFSHDMIDDPVVLYSPTTIDSPVDLCEGDIIKPKFEDPHYKNLLVQSIAYYRHHKLQMVDTSLKEEALEIFRSKKVIVISGSRGNGKTTLALSLLSSYQDGHYLILTEPDDLSCIRFGVTCVVVIEDLGGKYMLDMSVIQKWLRKFDMLYAAVKEGKLNVIITCLSDRLSVSVADSNHPMLDSVLELPKLCKVKIKKESSAGYDTINIPARIKQKDSSLFTNVKGIHTHVVDLPENFDSYYAFQQFCQHPDGSFLALFIKAEINDSNEPTSSSKLDVQHISSNFQHKCNYDTDMVYDHWFGRCGICCTDSGDVVITQGSNVILYRLSSGTLLLINTKELDIYYIRVFFNRNQIYCYNNCNISILDLNLNRKRKVELDLFSCFDYHDDDVEYVPCSQHLFFSVDSYQNSVLCEDTRLKQIKCVSKKNFNPVHICAATEDSVFLLGEQDHNHARIIQVNSDMAVLADISIEESIEIYTWSEGMVYDRDKGRLVICGRRGKVGKNCYVAIDLE